MRISPTGITISFGGTRDGGDDSRPVVARIFGFESGAQDVPINREMVVPAGQSVEESLPQGLYTVELTLPSGRIIQRNVTIDDDTNEVYQFFEDFAPHPGFSLQESVGRERADILSGAAAASGNTSSDDYASALSRAHAVAKSEREDRARRGAGPRSTTRFLVEPSFDAPPPPTRATLAVRDGWAGAPGGEAPDATGWIASEPAEQRGDTALWRIAYDEPAKPKPATRRWARVELPDGGVELASLPLPWFSSAASGFALADVLVDPARNDGAATTVAVRDERLAGLLAFLDRGHAGAARPMLEALERDNVIEQTIYDKTSNPLAACAAGYVGLAVYPPDEREQWDQWLENCMRIFPGVPDAAIVHARRLVLRPTSDRDNAAAADALRRACTAGPPYFSAGVALLREMLLLLSADHPTLAPLAEDAARLAGRVDATQAFTVLRYAPPRPPQA